MEVSINCAECNARCSAKINDVKELDATWYCPKCFNSNKYASYKSAEQQALDSLKKFCIV